MDRKTFIKISAASGVLATTLPGFAIHNLRLDVQDRIPLKFKTIIDHLVSKDPGYWNTDWDGTMAMESLLGWSNRGIPGTMEYARQWLDFHIENDHKLTDREFYNTFTGPGSCRIIRGRHLPFTMYSGFFGLPFPCYELYKINGDIRAKHICMDVANAILHKSARNKYGLVLHDDGINSREGSRTFTIPDSIYFVTKALMIASMLDEKHGEVYRDQALYQIKTCSSVFLDRERGLARTVLFETGPGKTFWCRATGWLAYALTGVLRFLPREHPDHEVLSQDLKVLAEGVMKYQGPNGGLHVLIDKPETGEETSGTAMCVTALKEAAVKGWIPDDYGLFLKKGWNFVKNHVSDHGEISGVYTGWAITAEEGKIIMDQSNTERGWIPAVILNAANVMTYKENGII
jgi:rhamnogalacturonyl hydrolase YesR